MSRRRRASARKRELLEDVLQGGRGAGRHRQPSAARLVQKLGALVVISAVGIVVMTRVIVPVVFNGTHAKTANASEQSSLGLAQNLQTNTIAPGRHLRSMQFEGIDRHYVEYMPHNVAPGQIVPVVIALHGVAQTWKNIEAYSGLDHIAELHHFAVIYPNGVNGAWNAGTCCGTSARDGVDDVGFIAALLQQSRSELVTDRMHSYLVGYSNGGMLAVRYACEHTGDIAGIGVVSATLVATSPDGSEVSCSPQGTTRAIFINGLADTLVPLGGGYNQHLDSPIMAVAKAVTHTSLNDCVSSRRAPSSTDKVTIFDGVQCSAGAQRVVTVAGLDHRWTRDSQRYGIDESIMLINYLLPR